MFAGSFAGCWCWWLSWVEGAVEAAGQVEILKWASDVVGQCHPGLTEPKWILDRAGFGNHLDSDRLQFFFCMMPVSAAQSFSIMA